ncbi:MAG: phage tail protein [Ferruginibacter sp.]
MKNNQFVLNAERHDPYKNFKFRVRFNGQVVAGISKVSALKQSTEAVTHREGGDPSSSRVTPSVWKFEPITLERGVTHDKEFEEWAKLIWNMEGDASISLENFRKSLTIELLNEQGVVAKAYKIYRCWVSEYQALPELDSNAHAIAIERLVLQNEGWERDYEIPEPKQY